MDFWEWLQSVLGRKPAVGTRENPGVLPPQTVYAWHKPLRVNGEIAYPYRDKFEGLANSPYVTDTLQALLGSRGPVPVVFSGSGSVANPGERRRGEYVPGDARSSDYVSLLNTLWETSYSPASHRGTLTHEFGHAFDFRGVDPEVVQRVKRTWEPQFASRFGHLGSNPEEWFAASFRQAVDYLLEVGEATRAAQADELFSVADSVKARRETSFLPGTDTLIQYLLGTPVFQAHPLNRPQQRQ